MTKDNLLFGLIGVLLGVIVGFLFANSVIQRGPAGTSRMPADHPTVGSSGPGQNGGMQPAVKAALDKAASEPNNVEAQMQAAQMFTQIQQYDQAIQYLMKANTVEPDNYNVIVALGNTNFDAQNYEAAEKWYTAALAKKPDDIDVLTDHGLSLMFRAKPDYDKALGEFNKALKIDPKHEQTLQDVVVALTEKKDAAAADQALKKLIEVNPQNSAVPELQSKIEALRNGNSNAAAKK